MKQQNFAINNVREAVGDSIALMSEFANSDKKMKRNL